MFNRIPQQAAALGLAAAVTFAVLSSIALLAARPAADSLLACAGTPVQGVAVEGRRLATI